VVVGAAELCGIFERDLSLKRSNQGSAVIRMPPNRHNARVLDVMPRQSVIAVNNDPSPGIIAEHFYWVNQIHGLNAPPPLGKAMRICQYSTGRQIEEGLSLHGSPYRELQMPCQFLKGHNAGSSRQRPHFSSVPPEVEKDSNQYRG
jgi:hypothetical protein